MEKTFILGHKNPDTDSVTAAITLSYLKNKLGGNTEPRVLGSLNKETSYVLDRFNIKTPKFLNDVKVQIEDINYDKSIMINKDQSVYEVYNYMIEKEITGIPVVNDDNSLFGYVSLKEIATDSIKGEFDSLKTSYQNIVDVLEGEEILKFTDNIEGDVVGAAFSSDAFISTVEVNKSIVIVGGRRRIISYCIEKGAKLIVLVGNAKLKEEDIALAKEKKVNIIRTNKNSFEVFKKIRLSNYIKNIVRNETPVLFTPKDYLSDFIEVSNKLKHTNYPIVDKNGICAGMVKLLDISSYNKKKVVLVDHNDLKQSVDGLTEATIEEIVDHHALGNLTTTSPISFRNMSVGSCNTIIYKLYQEAGIEIPKDIAALMLSGILSDTLILKSPTTTDIDRKVVSELANIAGLDYEEYGMDMLKAGSSLDGLSIEDIVYYDYKEFQTNDINYGIGQILTLDYESILSKKEEYIKFMDEAVKAKGLKLMTLYVTDIINNGSYVLYNSNAKKVMDLAYSKDMEEGTYLDGVISRKKQIVPVIMSEIENMN